MAAVPEKRFTVADYERAADDYARSLPLEHYMEGVPQATQRRITLSIMALLEVQRRDCQVFNELLVQYFYQGQLRQVVPDNMVRLFQGPPVSLTSYICEEEPVGPFWVLEYVSPSNPRKDYHDNFQKYEQELKVPYNLLFYPAKQDLRLHRLGDNGYELVVPNAQGRLPLPELELELALLDGWVRFWFRGELVPLPADLLLQLRAAMQRAEQAERRAEQEQRRAEQEQHRADQAEAELARLRQLLATMQPGLPGPMAPPQA